MRLNLTHGRAVAVMVMVTLMWSIAGVVTRQLEQARSFEVTFWRSFFTVVSLLVILPLVTPRDAAGRGVFAQMPWRSRAFWISGVCWSVMFTMFMIALTLTTVANVLVTLAVGPLFTALVARVAIGHQIAPRTWAAIVVAGLGIGYMFGTQIDLGGGLSGAAGGMLVALCVPLAGAINWTLTQHSQAHGERIDLVPAVLVGAAISSLVTLPLSLPLSASGSDVAWLALLGLVQLAVPCMLAVRVAGYLKAPEVSLLALLEVLFGILWAWLWAGETPGREVLLGGTLVIGALVANEWLGFRQRASA